MLSAYEHTPIAPPPTPLVKNAASRLCGSHIWCSGSSATPEPLEPSRGLRFASSTAPLRHLEAQLSPLNDQRVRLSAHGHAAIHPDGLAGDIGGIVGGEEGHGGGDLLRLAIAAHRHDLQRRFQTRGIGSPLVPSPGTPKSVFLTGNGGARVVESRRATAPPDADDLHFAVWPNGHPVFTKHVLQTRLRARAVAFWWNRDTLLEVLPGESTRQADARLTLSRGGFEEGEVSIRPRRGVADETTCPT
jgi:hypothetical protein